MRRVVMLSALCLAVLSTRAGADDRGSFVVRLGRDTTAVETYTRSASKLEVHQVSRTPRVQRGDFFYEYDRGRLVRFRFEVRPADAQAPVQRTEGRADGDTLRIEARNGDGPVRKRAVALPPGTLAIAFASAWAGYEHEIMQMVASGRSERTAPVYFVGAPTPAETRYRKLDTGEVEVSNDRGTVFRVRIDKAGRMLSVTPVAGTVQYALERVDGLDLDALANRFAGLEKSGSGLGVLSPRDTVTAEAGGAGLWFDYGRPHKRGRTIFGTVVPFGEVWRTGANAATQFRTAKAVEFGGVTVPEGFYTLWTIPSDKGWKLLVNSQTGQWGTQHDPAKDVYVIDMRTETLAAPVEEFTISVQETPHGGVVHFDWDTTRASAVFSVVE